MPDCMRPVCRPTVHFPLAHKVAAPVRFSVGRFPEDDQGQHFRGGFWDCALGCNFRDHCTVENLTFTGSRSSTTNQRCIDRPEKAS